MAHRILLIERDPAVRNALAFSLGLEGFDVRVADAIETVDTAALEAEGICLVVGHEPGAADLFGALTRGGRIPPTVVLATNPGRALRAQVAAAGARLVEKPLIGDVLSDTLRDLLPVRKAA